MIDIALAVMLYFTFMMICVINEREGQSMKTVEIHTKKKRTLICMRSKN